LADHARQSAQMWKAFALRAFAVRRTRRENG
jgi:hypothetical protein